ncbi:hypothetical protein K2X05_12835, partial [bacterium]|nr:hypothetical protein [bacterium]
MKILLTVFVTLTFSISSYAGILCSNLNEGIEEFYLGYSSTKGCFMTLKRTDDGGRVSYTN